jgi:D-alanyl-D-alanine carboxypeptidase
LSLLLLGLIAVSAYSLSRYLQVRENKRVVEQQLTGEIQAIIGHCEDQILRHPDYDLEAERQYLSSFSQKSQKDQLRSYSQLREFSVELAENLLLRSAGVKPGEERWSEVVRYKTYSPGGFKDLYEQVEYPRTETISEAPPITGHSQADQRIVELAIRRGYKLRRQADENALIHQGRHALQEQAMTAWRRLQATADQEGVQLELVSAYRSVDRQRQIFLRELRALSLQQQGREYTGQEIAAGVADRWIKEVLRYSSIPGFSKHHSGYTIDISDPSSGHGFTEFAQTRGFTWISAHNYLNAKRFGFIPSYPAGAVGQGPEPEPWEYVWVGRERLLLRSTGEE